MRSNSIGDRSCKHNAHNPNLRCGINPYGPCEGCPDYAKASLSERLKRRFWVIDRKNKVFAKDIALEITSGFTFGIPLGIVILIGVVVPGLNTMILKTHPCWPVIGVTQYCNRPHQHR